MAAPLPKGADGYVRGLPAEPASRSFLYDQYDSRRQAIVLVENFR